MRALADGWEGLFFFVFLLAALALVNGLYYLMGADLEWMSGLGQEGLKSFKKVVGERYEGTGPGLLFLGKDGLPHPIDLNIATDEELVLLPGIGKKRALRIIDERNGRGFFLTKDELVMPYGPIPEEVCARISPLVKGALDGGP